MRAGQVEGLSVRPFNIAAQEVKEEEEESEDESEVEGVKRSKTPVTKGE